MGAATKVASLFGELAFKDDMTPGLEKAERGANHFSGAIRNSFSVALGIGMAKLGGFGLSIAHNVIFEAIDAEVNIKKLEAVIKSTGGAADVSSQQAQDWADSLSQVTRFSDDAILQSETMLLTFTRIGKDVFPDATEATLNMAEMFGGDATQAAIQLGKALNDPIEGVTALRRVGVMLTDQQEEQIKQFMAVGDIASAQKVILGELNTEFGGLARAAGDTLSGKLTILQNRLLNVAETVGMSLLPYVESFADRVLNSAVPAIEKFGTTLTTTFQNEGLQGVGQLILDGITAGLSDIGGWARINIIYPAIEALLFADWSGVANTALHLLESLGAGIVDLKSWVDFNVVYPLVGWLLEADWSMATPAIEHLMSSLGDSVGDLNVWALDNIIQPLLDGIVAAAEDPSTPEKLGKFVELALVTLAGFFVVMPGWVLEHVVTPFMDGLISSLSDGDVLKKIERFGQSVIDLLVAALADLPGAFAQAISDAIPDTIDLSKYGLGEVTIPDVSLPSVDLGKYGFGHDFVGPYKSGQPYLVGTGAQPELFVPGGGGGGMAYPAGSYSMGGGDTRITIQLDSATLFDGVVSEGGRRNVTIFAGSG
jgi:hypothetical protein